VGWWLKLIPLIGGEKLRNPKTGAAVWSRRGVADTPLRAQGICGALCAVGPRGEGAEVGRHRAATARGTA